VQVVVQHPAESRLPGSARRTSRLLAGVRAQQFVEGETARCLLGGQVRGRQLFEAPARLAGR
jgi:hypothetical protein